MPLQTLKSNRRNPISDDRFESKNPASSPFAKQPSSSHRPSKRSLNEPSKISRSYAFVEFRSQRDAEDAYYDMHGKTFEGSRLSIQWAKSPPSSVWRYDRAPPRSSRDRDRSRSPRRRSEKDDRDRDRDRNRDRDRERDVEDRDQVRDRDTRRRRSRSPDRRRSRTPERRRSASPDRKREDPDDRARTPARMPPPVRDDEEVKREEDRAQTPP